MLDVGGAGDLVRSDSGLVKLAKSGEGLELSKTSVENPAAALAALAIAVSPSALSDITLKDLQMSARPSAVTAFTTSSTIPGIERLPNGKASPKSVNDPNGISISVIIAHAKKSDPSGFDKRLRTLESSP